MVKISRLLFTLFMALSALSSQGIDTNEDFASTVLMDDPVGFGIKMKTLVTALKEQDHDQVELLLQDFTQAERTVLFTLIETLEQLPSSQSPVA